MADAKIYTERVLENLQKRNPHEPEYIQAVREVLLSLNWVIEEHPEYQDHALLERMVEPDRMIGFKVVWQDDAGRVQVNRGYRIQFNQAIGPYKGGLRFHPSVNPSVLKFLGFEQTFKNALTGLPMGGGKGGSDFDPKGKSDAEIMRFCQSFMLELYRHIGSETDVPAGDIGVGAREVGYLFGMYKKIRNEHVGVLTGKGLSYGGSLARTEATGYGALYIIRQILEDRGDSLEGKTIALSGSGNVAIYACEKAHDLGAKILTMSDSSGYVYDSQGIDLDLIKEIKLEKRDRIHTYLEKRPEAQFFAGQKPWQVKVDIAIPAATQNEEDLEDAKQLVENATPYYFEASNMSTTEAAVNYLLDHKVLVGPSKAINAGGVAVSGLEMSQNASHVAWSFKEVDKKLEEIMAGIYKNISEAAQDYAGSKDALIVGANIAGFKRVAQAMLEQGYVF